MDSVSAIILSTGKEPDHQERDTMNNIAELFQALGEPFPADQIKTRPGRGSTQLKWVPAAAVVARLNSLMPGAWEFNVEQAGDNVVRGTLTLHLPNGTVRTYSQFGYTNDGGAGAEALKEASTDALRRCAAFGPGIGLDLYGGAVVARPAAPSYDVKEKAMALEGQLIKIMDTLVNKHHDVDTGIKIITALSKEKVGRAANLPLPKLEAWVAAARKRLDAAEASGKVAA